MKAYISQTFIGLVAFGEDGKIIDKLIYPQDVKKIVDCLENTEPYIDELKKKLLKMGFPEIEIKIGFPYFRDFARNIGYSDTQINKLITQIGIELAKRRIKKTVKKDKIIIQAVSAIDELDKSINIFVERLREWYGLHFPELEESTEKHEKFVKIVSDYGLRNKIPENLLPGSLRDSIGIELSNEDESILKEYAENLKNFYKLREHLEKYIERTMKEIAPNFTEVATPILGARFIALSGGLEKLAKMPSSTIQLMGAEKALFRYLRGKGQSPKHGILYTHPEVQKAPIDKRGKIARILASKISIAVKMDYYGSENASNSLRDDLDKKIKETLRDNNEKK